MKKIYALIFLIMFTLAGCNLETKTLPEFYEEDLNDVSKITIVDGNTGAKKTLKEPVVIEELLDKVRNIKFIPDKNQEERSGFNYSITLFEDDEEGLQFGLTQINGGYYHTKPDIYPIVDEFYRDMKKANHSLGEVGG